MLLTDQEREELLALERDPAQGPWKMLARIERFLKRAEAEGRWTASQAENDAEIAILRARALLRIGAYPTTVHALTTLLHALGDGLAVENPAWYGLFAETLMHAGRLPEARETIEEAAKVTQLTAEGWAVCAKLRAHFGNSEGAREALDAALALEPESFALSLLREDFERRASLTEMCDHEETPELEARRRALRLDSGYAIKRRRYLSNMVANEAGLERLTKLLKLRDLGPASNRPDYESATFALKDGLRVPIVFHMSRAGVSNLSPLWAERMLSALTGVLSMNDIESTEVEEVQIEVNLSVNLMLRKGGPNGVLGRLTFRLPHDTLCGPGEILPEDAPEEERTIMEEIERDFRREAFGRVVKRLSELEGNALTPRLASELARAICNEAQAHERDKFERALALLEGPAAALGEVSSRHFRRGYALYFLDRDREAAAAFELAARLDPASDAALEMLARTRLQFEPPVFARTFAERADEVWSRLEAEERSLMLLESDEREGAVELLSRITEILSPVSSGWAVEFGRKAETFELILSPNGSRLACFPLFAFAKRMPENLRPRWRLRLGRQAIDDPASIALRAQDRGIDAAALRFWPEPLENGWRLSVWSSALDRLEDYEEESCVRALNLILSLTLGEAVRLRWILDVNILTGPKPERGFDVNELRQFIRTNEPESAGYTLGAWAVEGIGFRFKPRKESKLPLRLDVKRGTSTCPQLIVEYPGPWVALQTLYEAGADAGFLWFEVRESDERDARIEAIMEKLEKHLSSLHDVQIVGRLVGTMRGYFDFIFANGPELPGVKEILAAEPDVVRAGLQPFHLGYPSTPFLEEAEDESQNDGTDETDEGGKREEASPVPAAPFDPAGPASGCAN